MVPTIRIEREALPGGRAAAILQADGVILLKVDPNEITDRGAVAIARLFQQAMDSDRLTQNWPGDPSPGQSAAGPS